MKENNKKRQTAFKKNAVHAMLLAIITSVMMMMQIQPSLCGSFEPRNHCKLHWAWETEGGQGWGSPSIEAALPNSLMPETRALSASNSLHYTVQVKKCPQARQWEEKTEYVWIKRGMLFWKIRMPVAMWGASSQDVHNYHENRTVYVQDVTSYWG